MNEMREAFFGSDGVSLHYIDWGGEGPPLVLLAGLGGTAHLFRGLAPKLSSRFRVVALTRRGHGRSDRPESGYEIDTLVDDIHRFLDELEIERAVLVGHSFAGVEIPKFATRYPERLEAVVYLDALYVFLEPLDPSEDPVWKVLDTTRPNPKDLVSTDAIIEYLKRTRPDLASIWCEAVEADRLEDLTIKDGRVVDDLHGQVVSKKMFAGMGLHSHPAYGEVKVPMLAIVRGGSTHPFLPPDASGELERSANAYYVEKFRPHIQRRTALFREAAPKARIVELDTSNHTLFIAKEDETVDAILTFLG